MLAELKMVCQERLLKIKGSFEDVKPVDLIVAVRARIEALTTQEQLNRLGGAVKEKYKDIFSPIPHLDKLPTDVYC